LLSGALSRFSFFDIFAHCFSSLEQAKLAPPKRKTRKPEKSESDEEVTFVQQVEAKPESLNSRARFPFNQRFA
jgi:hypothetical protein